jgi:hypothetical protein
MTGATAATDCCNRLLQQLTPGTSATLPYLAAFSKKFEDVSQTFSEHCIN